MHLTDEAGHLYLLSKDLVTLNKKLRKMTSKAEKHFYNLSRAKTLKEKHHYQSKHMRATIELTHLMNKHHQLLEKLRHHHSSFDLALKREHRI